MTAPKRLPWFFLVPAFLVLAELSYSLVLPLATGLDPSWANGIARAAELHLVFGRAIVFTYGHLGFLAAGMRLPDCFPYMVLARVGIALTFSASVVYYCATLPSRRFLITFTAVSFAAFLVRNYHTTVLIGAAAAVAMLLIDRRSRHQPYEATVIGILAGLAFLTKFSLGVQFAAAVGSVLIFEVARELRAAPRVYEGTYSLAAFIIASVATMGAVLNTSIDPPAICAGLWCLCIATLVVAINVRFKAKRATVATVSFSILVAVSIALGDTRDFIANSLQLSLGYSDAMNKTPATTSSPELAMGVLLLALLILVAVSQRSVLSAGAIVGITVLGWLNFKEGYVRQGPGHVIEYLIPMVLLFALLTKSAPTQRTAAVSLLAFAVAFFCFAAKTVGDTPISGIYTLSEVSAPLNDWHDAIFGTGGDAHSLSGLAADVFDDGSADRLKSLPIDVQPWEASIAFANQLAWKPEPVFQSVSAYTPALDLMNAQSLAAGGRRVLVDFVAIDGRNFMAESPLARRELLCRYRLDSQFGRRLARVRGGEQFAVLSVSQSDRCRRIGATTSEPITWDREYPLPATARDTLTFLALHLPYSLQGTITKTLFRGPVVTIDIRDGSGAVANSRVLPENAVNGFLVGPNPATTNDFTSILAGGFTSSSKTFAIHTNEPELFRHDLEATFERVSYVRG